MELWSGYYLFIGHLCSKGFHAPNPTDPWRPPDRSLVGWRIQLRETEAGGDWGAESLTMTCPSPSCLSSCTGGRQVATEPVRLVPLVQLTRPEQVLTWQKHMNVSIPVRLEDPRKRARAGHRSWTQELVRAGTRYSSKGPCSFVHSLVICPFKHTGHLLFPRNQAWCWGSTWLMTRKIWSCLEKVLVADRRV